MHRMFRRLSVVAGVFTLGLVLSADAGAQALTGPTCSAGGPACGHTLNATVPTLVTLTLENNATALGNITAAHFDNGQQVAGPLFDVKANRGYSITLASVNAAFTATGGANAAKSAGDARWARTTAAAGCASPGAYTPITTTAVGVYTGTAGNAPRQQLCFDIVWNYASDTPGGYTLPLNVSVSAP
jgi:hypothetical protein